MRGGEVRALETQSGRIGNNRAVFADNLLVTKVTCPAAALYSKRPIIRSY
jgi:hypothetical protein